MGLGATEPPSAAHTAEQSAQQVLRPVGGPARAILTALGQEGLGRGEDLGINKGGMGIRCCDAPEADFAQIAPIAQDGQHTFVGRGAPGPGPVPGFIEPAQLVGDFFEHELLGLGRYFTHFGNEDSYPSIVSDTLTPESPGVDRSLLKPSPRFRQVLDALR